MDDFGANAVNPGNNYYDQPNNADGSGLSSDGFIVEINNTQTVVWATLYGGNSGISTYNHEGIYAVAVTGTSELFITGIASSTNFPYRCDPATAYCYEEQNTSELQDAFCAKFDLTGGVGIFESTETQSGFDVYPNPASDQLTITIGDNIDAGSRFSICNALGQVVYTVDLSPADQNRNFTIDIGFLATGMYFARLDTPAGNSTEKFIKE